MSAENLTITVAIDAEMLDNPAAHEGIADLFREAALDALRKRGSDD